MKEETRMISVTERGLMNHTGVSTTTVGAKTAGEALEAAGMNWKVELRDAGYRVRGGVFKQSQDGHRAVVKVVDGEATDCFGFVGRKYTPIQNDDMFTWCDRLVDDAGANYESAWTMYGGREVGLTMRFPEQIMIGGEDPVNKYLLLRGRHDGTGSVTAQVTAVQLFCTNMLNVASRKAESTVRIRHLTGATGKLAAARETLKVTFQYMDAMQAELEAMTQRTIAEDYAKQIVDEVLADHKFGGREAKVSRIIQLGNESETLVPNFRGTRYGLFHGVTEWLDWERQSKTPHGALVDALDGRVRRVKQDVFNRLVAT